jgi:hypothetical protein
MINKIVMYIRLKYLILVKYKTIKKIKEVLEIYCETNKFKYNNFDLLIKNEF